MKDLKDRLGALGVWRWVYVAAEGDGDEDGGWWEVYRGDVLVAEVLTCQADAEGVVDALNRVGSVRGGMLDVAAFHLKHGLPVHQRPTCPGVDRLDLRIRLIAEEAKEAVGALGALKDARQCVDETSVLPEACKPDWLQDGPAAAAVFKERLGHVGKELADVLFVVLGCALELGLPMEELWQAVCDSNATKISDPDSKDAGGKVVKGPAYVPPDTRTIIESRTDPNCITLS